MLAAQSAPGTLQWTFILDHVLAQIMNEYVLPIGACLKNSLIELSAMHCNSAKIKFALAKFKKL